MMLPHAAGARVERQKITEYLLNPAHPRGKSKARFLVRYGFSRGRWQELAEALRQHGQSNPVVAAVDSCFGTKYNVEGPLRTPDGRNPRVRTVWITAPASREPRLVTAFPAEEFSDDP